MFGVVSVVGEELATLGLGEAAPNAVGFTDAQRELETIVADLAFRANAFGARFPLIAVLAPFTRRGREEQNRFRAAACSFQMPRFMYQAERHALLQFPAASRDGRERNRALPEEQKRRSGAATPVTVILGTT